LSQHLIRSLVQGQLRYKKIILQKHKKRNIRIRKESAGRNGDNKGRDKGVGMRENKGDIKEREKKKERWEDKEKDMHCTKGTGKRGGAGCETEKE
jgi:hypothetical protein